MNRQERFFAAFVVVSLVVLIILIGNFLSNEAKENSNSTVENKSGLNETEHDLTVADGFKISVFAEDLGSPRDIIEDEKGNLLFTDPENGKIFVLEKSEQEELAGKTELLSGLSRPHGLAFHPRDSKKLYVAETDKVSVYTYDPASQKATEGKKILDLPSGGGHFTRSLLFLPETTKLLISVGSSCNICNESDDKRARVLISNDDGSDLKTYAAGLRNAVFLTTGSSNSVWITEMGRDNLGDDLPPDEINILKEGADYGWPKCYGKNIPDPFGGTAEICQPKAESKIDLPAHVAPLGLSFFDHDIYPKDWQNDLLVAYHGSWNRTEPTGYKLVRIKLNDNNEFEGEEDFITGWLRGRRITGRPTDVFLSRSGNFFVSDDREGVIYKIEYMR